MIEQVVKREYVERVIANEKIKMEDMEIKELFYDSIFKGVFSKQENVLLKFIKILLDIKERYDDPVSIIGYELPISKKKGKINRGDILLKLSDNSYINIEMNKGRDSRILKRNIVQVSRIYGNLRKSGKKESELEDLKVKQLNLNNFRNVTGKPIEHILLCEKELGEIISDLISLCNIDIEMCYRMVYNKGIRNVSKAVRIGAMLLAKSLKELSYILGDDILSMKEKEKFLEYVKEVNEDEKIIQDWMAEENAEMKEEGMLIAAREDGHAEGLSEGVETNKIEVIQNMLNKKFDYQTISDITGKTISEIKEIEKNI